MTATLTPKQREANRLLASTARNIMLRGGSRSGKTFLLVRAIIQRAINAPNSRHAIFRFRFNHAKTSIWSDTLPKVLKLCFPTLRVRFDKTDFYVELPNGSQIWIAGLDDKDRVEKILGQEYATLYFNESSQIPWGSIETAMSRLAQKVELAAAIAKATGRTHLALKAYFDCNPPSKLHWSYQLFRAKLKPGTKEALPDPDNYVEMRINPDDNRENLPEEYFEVLDGMSSAKRTRFRDGEWASEVNGALWSLEDRTAHDGKPIPGIDSLRVAQAPKLQRIVVAVDPSGTKGDGGGDDIGIVVAGLGFDGHGYILEDATCQMGPEGWGRRAVERYGYWQADRIIGEKNFGGDMVRFTIRTADNKVPYRDVSASRGKAVRAEPISALYEQGKVHHVGDFPDLEDQMCLAAGTLVETDRGMVPIEDITTQHRVLTRKGFAPIKWAGYTGHASEFVEIGSSTGKIRATKAHPIFDTDTGEFVSAANVPRSQRLLVSRKWESMAARSRGADSGIIGCPPATIAMRAARCFIERFTRRISVPSHRGWISTMWTAIPAIMSHPILKQYHDPSTSASTGRSDTLDTPPRLKSANVRSAGKKPSLWARSRAATARIAATCERIGRKSLALRSSHSLANDAEQLARPSESDSSALGVARTITMLRSTHGESEPVYNLSVADGYLPEFFANGILVHNCNFTASGYVGEGSPDRADALVWALTELMLTGSNYSLANA